jgi:hypothetical protein
VRLRLRASVSSALLPGRDAHSPIAPRVLSVLGVRARPARLSASDRQPVPPVLPDARRALQLRLMPRPPPLRAVVKAARRRAALKLQQLHDAARRCCVVRLLCRCGELRRQCPGAALQQPGLHDGAVLCAAALRRAEALVGYVRWSTETGVESYCSIRVNNKQALGLSQRARPAPS